MDEEFALVKQALFTEPDDQSGWLYHRWLVGQVTRGGACGTGGAGVASRDVLEREAEGCRCGRSTTPPARGPRRVRVCCWMRRGEGAAVAPLPRPAAHGACA